MAESQANDFQEDLAALRAHFRASGFHEVPTARLVAAWVAHLAIALAGLAVFVAVPSLAVRIPAILVSTFGFMGLAAFGHTASHNAVSDSRLWNRLVASFSYPFLFQMSGLFWHHSHVQTHHAAPNIVGLDNDCDLRPFFAINERHQKDAGPLRRAYYACQWLILPLILGLNVFNIQRKGWRHLIRKIRRPEGRTPAVWADLGWLTLHIVVWIGAPMLFFPAASVLGLYALRMALMGFGIFAILAPGHFPAEAVCLGADQRDAGDFHLRQTVTTLNFRTGPIGRFLCAGLEYQIEHHLFPSICHVHYPKISPLVAALCRRHGLPHRTLGWGEAIWKSYRVFFVPKPVLTSVEALRGAPMPQG